MELTAPSMSIFEVSADRHQPTASSKVSHLHTLSLARSQPSPHCWRLVADARMQKTGSSPSIVLLQEHLQGTESLPVSGTPSQLAEPVHRE
jgi:hypothetical protein